MMIESVEEVKRRARGQRHASYTRTFEISPAELREVHMEMENLLRREARANPNYVMVAAAVFEDVLGIREYTPSQLLRLAVFLDRSDFGTTMGTLMLALQGEIDIDNILTKGHMGVGR